MYFRLLHEPDHYRNGQHHSQKIAQQSKDDFPTLFWHTLDIISCLAMSTGCERVFSSVKKLITSERNYLGEDIIKTCEFLKA
jgi:hypothetical protein